MLLEVDASDHCVVNRLMEFFIGLRLEDVNPINKGGHLGGAMVAEEAGRRRVTGHFTQRINMFDHFAFDLVKPPSPIRAVRKAQLMACSSAKCWRKSR